MSYWACVGGEENWTQILRTNQNVEVVEENKPMDESEEWIRRQNQEHGD